MKIYPLSFFLFITTVFSHKLDLNEYTSERCAYVDQSIDLKTDSSHNDISVRYLIFHYRDTLISNIPEFKHHDKDSPPQCDDGAECGYEVKFDSDAKHDVVQNGVLTKTEQQVKLEVKDSPGFYCVYLDANNDYSGEVNFANSFGELDIDNYTRLRFKRSFYLPILTLLVIIASVLKFPLRFKRFVGLVWLMQVFETASLALVSKYGLGLWTMLFNFVFANLGVYLILGFIIAQIMYHSVGYGIVDDDSMISKNIKIMHMIVGAFVVLKCLSNLFFHFSLIPYYDLHFNSIRRFLLLLQYIPYAFIYVTITFESISLRKDFTISDPRIKSSFRLFIIIPPAICIFKLLLGAFVVHRSDALFYDVYYKDISVLILTFTTDVVVLLGIVFLGTIWRPISLYQRLDNPVGQDIELGEVRR